MSPDFSNPDFVRIVEAVVSVRSLFAQIEKDKTSLVSPVGIKDILLPALTKRLSEKSPFSIVVSCRMWNTKQVSGLLQRYSDHARIIYSGHLNTCWGRFVLCKELAHLLVDTGDHQFTRDPVSLVQQIITKIPLGGIDNDVHSENLAAIAATEMLLPWKFRKQMVEDFSNGKSDMEIAKQFSVPELIVSMMRGKYGQLSHLANSISFQ